MMRGRRLITRGKNSNNKNDNKAETIYISAVQCQKILIKRNKKSKRGGVNSTGSLRWIRLGFWSGRELSSPQCLTLLFDGGGGENESNSFLS